GRAGGAGREARDSERAPETRHAPVEPGRAGRARLRRSPRAAEAHDDEARAVGAADGRRIAGNLEPGALVVVGRRASQREAEVAVGAAAARCVAVPADADDAEAIPEHMSVREVRGQARAIVRLRIAPYARAAGREPAELRRACEERGQ